MSSAAAEDAKREAQKEVAECEKEIAAIKATVKSLAGPGAQQATQQHQDEADSSSSSAAGNNNALTVVFLKVEGLADENKEVEEKESSAKKLRLSLQLSSPIEEGVLSEMFDPELQQQDLPETMKVTFRGVETNQATLTLTATTTTATAETTTLGTSEPIDLSSMTKLDAMNLKKEYVTDLPVVIHTDAKEGDETAAAAAACTVTIRLTFVPSQKDQLEELYELLNKATTRKTKAVDTLRQIAIMASRQSAAASGARQMTTARQPAVRAGFLNKAAPKKEPSKLQAFYDRYLGPQTLWRQLFPLAKNYIIFFVAVGAMHFKGQSLALPPPV